MKYGFIGVGKMGSALAVSVLKTDDSNNVIVSDTNLTARDEFVAKYNCKKGSIEDVITFADYIVLGIKPQGLEDLANEIKPLLKENTGIISMLAGTSIKKIETLLGNRPIFRIMPNIPCVIGKGMLICAGNDIISDQDMQKIKTDFSKAGEICIIEESKIDAASAVTGSGPAFVAIMIEAMADGLVACGIPRNTAYIYAAQTMYGTAGLVTEYELTPAEIKDMVCSPAGTTIEGINVLESSAFRGIVMDAVRATYEKTKNL